MQRRTLLTASALLGALLVSAAAWSAERSAQWAKLTPQQQEVLQPLQRDWAGIEPARQQKWLEVAARFPSMPADERLRVQQRMAEWARLTPTERARARLQFQQAREVPAAERQAKWKAYQALSDEERRQLALRARPTPKPVSTPEPTATMAKRNVLQAAPQPPRRMVAPIVVQAKPGATTTTMVTRATPPLHQQHGLPKIAATPGFVDPATLLPKRGPQGAAVRSAASADPTQQP